MLDVVRVSAIATNGYRLNEIVVLVLLLNLIVAHKHLCKYAGRILGWLKLRVVEKFNLILFVLFAFKIGQKTEFVEYLVLVEVVELAWYLFALACNYDLGYLAILAERYYYRLV